MRPKNGIVVASIIATVCCGFFAYGQSKDGNKPAANAVKKEEPAKKPAEPVKKPAEAPTSKANAAPAEDTQTQDEKAVRESAETFTRLYNEHDAKGLGALFANKAEVIDENEKVVKGRAAIEQGFADVFKANPEASMQVDVESVRVLTPHLAIEEGTALSKNAPDDIESVSTYVAIHVKIDGKWLLACVRDWAAIGAELTPHDRLLELGWLVGEWVEESADSTVHSVCKWDSNDNFLIQEFKIQVGGNTAMSGTMRVGWDAVKKQFKSWIFDSHGGYSEGLWHRNGDSWVVKSQGSTARGETVSSTSLHRQIDGDTLGWSSIDRIIDGERQDDIDEIVIKRRPPSPME